MFVWPSHPEFNLFLYFEKIFCVDCRSQNHIEYISLWSKNLIYTKAIKSQVLLF